MAVDMFLKLDGIKGESKQAGHEGEIDVLSFSWGAHQQATMAFGGGGGAGKVDFSDFNFSMQAGTATGGLMLACSTGKHIPTGVFTARKAGGGQKEFLKIKFTDLLVSSYQSQGSQMGGNPLDNVQLNFTKITFEYLEQDQKGNTKNTSNFEYDQKTGKGK